MILLSQTYYVHENCFLNKNFQICLDNFFFFFLYVFYWDLWWWQVFPIMKCDSLESFASLDSLHSEAVRYQSPLTFQQYPIIEVDMWSVWQSLGVAALYLAHPFFWSLSRGGIRFQTCWYFQDGPAIEVFIGKSCLWSS